MDSPQKDCQYYIDKINAAQDAEYLEIARKMRLAGACHEEIVEAILKRNHEHVIGAMMIGQPVEQN